MDAITLLKNDHKAVKALFTKFEKAGENAVVTKRKLVDQMIEELAVHATIEEQLFYPAVREAVPEAEEVVLEGMEEHHIVKWTLSELENMPADHERFEAKVTVLIESVRHHIEEEEGDMFPKVREAVGRKALGELGEAMEKAKATAPTRPRPKAPDTPPPAKAASARSGLLQKARGRRKVKAG